MKFNFNELKNIEELRRINPNILYYYYKRFSWIFHTWKSHKNTGIDRPVFFIGNQGDGISFISRIFRRHPDIVSISGNNKYWTGADETATVMELLLPKELRMTGHFLNTEPEHEKFSPPRSWSYGCDDLIGDYYKTEEDWTPKIEAKFKTVLKIPLARFGSPRSRFVDKSQLYIVKTRLIQKCLSGCTPYFVLITRNPYVTCYRAAKGKAGDLRRYSKFMDFEELMDISIQHWKNTALTIQRDKEYLENFIHVRFEDFLLEPEENAKRLCEFMNLSYQEKMLPHPNEKIPFGTRFQEKWFPINHEVNKHYLERATPDIFKLVENRIGDLAASFGYYNPLKKH